MLTRRLLIPVLSVIIVAGCKKADNSYKGPINGTSWTATDYWQGIGAADDGWHSLPANAQTLVFDNKGKGLEYSNGVLNKGYNYQVTGDSTMEVKGDSVTQTGHDYYQIRNDVLEIWGIGCIEGCSTRYARIRAID